MDSFKFSVTQAPFPSVHAPGGPKLQYTKYNVVNLTAKILLRFQLAGIFYIFSTVLFEVLTDPLTDPLTGIPGWI